MVEMTEQEWCDLYDSLHGYWTNGSPNKKPKLAIDEQYMVTEVSMGWASSWGPKGNLIHYATYHIFRVMLVKPDVNNEDTWYTDYNRPHLKVASFSQRTAIGMIYHSELDRRRVAKMYATEEYPAFWWSSDYDDIR